MAQMRRDIPTAMYVQIADALREEIYAQRYEPSGRLPSEEETRARFGVSRVTVRQAFAQLESEGLIHRRKGKGTFTSGKQVRHSLDTLRSFHESLVLQGFEATIQLISAELLRPASASADRGDQLGFRLKRLHLADSSPVAVGLSQLPAAVAGVDWSRANAKPVYAVIEDVLGAPVKRADLGLRLVRANEETAGWLDVQVGQPLLLLDRTSWTGLEVCVDRSQFYIRPERYEFTLSSNF
jgi:GntR family transcriptional regulator